MNYPTYTSLSKRRNTIPPDMVRLPTYNRTGANMDEQLQRAVDAGQLKPRAVMAINRAANETPLQSSFKKLSLADALKVYSVMTDKEQREVSDILDAKKARKQ